MSKTTPKRVIVMPTDAENRKIRAAAKLDPDATLLTEDQLKAMVPLKSLRGRPKSDNAKLLISIRYSPEVITYFRNTGKRVWWAFCKITLQSRIHGVQDLSPDNSLFKTNALPTRNATRGYLTKGESDA